MHTLMIDGSRYASAEELHHALKRLLSLPDYYGMNADALNDCISERTEPLSLWIASSGNDEVARAIRLICAVVEDNGGSVKEL